MRIKSQDEVLSLKVRKKIIEEIESNENKVRKKEAYRRSQCYKDRTAEQVIEMLRKQFSQLTVDEMSYAITNLSIVKKVIKKKSRVYQNGVERIVDENKEATEKIAELEEIFDFNKKMKSQNRWTKLHKNAVHYIKPCPFLDEEGEKFMRPRPTVLQPHLYDVVEDFYDRTEPLCYILSNFNPDEVVFTTADPARVRDGVRVTGQNSVLGTQRTQGNRRDEVIADKKEDEGEQEKPNGKEYVWWTDLYHFTTNSLGTVIFPDESTDSTPELSPNDERIQNPIEEMPFVNTSEDQDNSFWAEGGEDLVDGAIVVNSLMTQINHIAVVQGYGQLWMSGKNLPDNVEVGPTSIIKLEHEISTEDPAPQVGVVQASPPLSELQDAVISQVALILTTNDLSTSSVSANLDSGTNFPSGIAMLIDKSESMEDVDDDREMFADAERDIWRIIAKFMQFFNENEELDPELTELVLPEEFDLTLVFGEPRVIASEKEKLDAIEKRKELGLNTQVELLMMDRKDFDEDMAKAKLKEIEDEKRARMLEMAQESPFLEDQQQDGDNNKEDELNSNEDEQ